MVGSLPLDQGQLGVCSLIRNTTLPALTSVFLHQEGKKKG